MILSRPVEYKGTTIEELSFHRATGAELKKVFEKAQKDSAEVAFFQMALLTGVDRQLIDLLDHGDFMALQKEMIDGDFFPKTPD